MIQFLQIYMKNGMILIFILLIFRSLMAISLGVPLMAYMYLNLFALLDQFRMLGGRTGLMVRASDSGSGDPGSILGRVGVFVSLSKRHLLPKSTGNTQE